MDCQGVTKLNKPCPWKAKPACGDFCKMHKNFVKQNASTLVEAEVVAYEAEADAKAKAEAEAEAKAKAKAETNDKDDEPVWLRDAALQVQAGSSVPPPHPPPPPSRPPPPPPPPPTPVESKTSKSGYMPKSQTDSWSTPNALYADLNKEFQFDKYDPCPLEDNPQNNGLVEEWAKTTFVNPPYSQLKTTKERLGWVEKAHIECQKGKTIVMLIPSRTDTQWFHDIILENSYEVRFVRGRLKFGDAKAAAPFPNIIVVMRPSEPPPTRTDKMVLMDEIETILKTVKETKQYRDKTKKVRFNLEWAFLLGEGTTSALGAKSFETPHNFKPGKGVCLTKVETRTLPKWKLKLWDLSKQLITLIDPDFAAGEFVVNYSCMSKPEQYVKKHVDSEDISHQYALTLGDYNGATLRMYDDEDHVLGEFDYYKRPCKFDGRLPHEVITDNFTGIRFTLVWFKCYDHRKTEADPIFTTPCYVN